MTTPFRTPDSAKAFHLDVKGVAPQDVIADALVVAVTTKGGNVEGDEPALRVPYVNLLDQPGFVAEGDEIPLADPDDSEVLVHTGKVAVYFQVSREQWGQADTASLLSNATRDALVRKANAAFLSQAAPTPPAVTPPAGLIHQGLTDVSSTIETDGLAALIDGVTTIEDAGGNANFVIASPQAWGYIEKKLIDGNDVSILGAGVQAATRSLLGIPVRVDRDAVPWSLIVGDSRSIISVYGNVLLATSEHAAFQRDSVAVRATFRFGAQVADTDRVVLVPVLDAT